MKAKFRILFSTQLWRNCDHQERQFLS